MASGGDDLPRPVARIGGIDDDALFARRQDVEARRLLVERYRGLAERLATRYRGRGEPVDDLEQVAMLALLRAIDRFDVSRGVKFATFATATILGELKRHLRDKTWSVRVPRSLQELWLDTSRTASELTQKLARSPTVAEIAAAMDVSQEEVLEALDAGGAYTAGSLDMPVGDDDGAARLVDLLPEIDETLLASDERLTLATRIERLPDRERTVLYLRFFEGLTQAEIATQIGVSQVHVSRILRRTLATLRRELGDAGD